MKKMIFIFLLLMNGGIIAQEETLIDGKVEIGGFGGPVVKFTSVNNEFAVMVGGYGGWLINHSFMIGGGGYGLTNNITPGLEAKRIYGDDTRITFGYGGLVLEYIGNSNKLVHYSISTLIGGGGIMYGKKMNGYNWDERVNYAVFVAEANLAAELNVTTFFRINAGIGYRFVSDTEIVGLKNSDLSAPSINLTFKFGKF